jgi:methylmalonyl-CoA/ethylmalonyl-CoA epimerase
VRRVRVADTSSATRTGGDQERLVRRLDHVAVAVRDAERAVELYVDALGGRFILGGDNDETGNRIIHLALGGFKVELMQPLRPDSALARSIDKRGEGFHHATMVVDDLEQTVETLGGAGIEVVGTDLSNPTWRETFVRPRDSGGALLQLVTTDRDWSKPVDGIALDDVLAGRVGFQDAWPCWRPQAAPADLARNARRSS